MSRSDFVLSSPVGSCPDKYSLRSRHERTRPVLGPIGRENSRSGASENTSLGGVVELSRSKRSVAVNLSPGQIKEWCDDGAIERVRRARRGRPVTADGPTGPDEGRGPCSTAREARHTDGGVELSTDRNPLVAARRSPEGVDMPVGDHQPQDLLVENRQLIPTDDAEEHDGQRTPAGGAVQGRAVTQDGVSSNPGMTSKLDGDETRGSKRKRGRQRHTVGRTRNALPRGITIQANRPGPRHRDAAASSTTSRTETHV